MKMLNMLGLYALLSASHSLVGVEGSLIPLMERIENIDELQKRKYAPLQLKEIIQALEHKSKKIRAVSYNLLFDRKDNLLEEVHQWPRRLPRLVELIRYMNADVLGVQEPYFNQIADLFAHMTLDFDFYSKPSQEGEINGIFYRKDRFELMNANVWSMTTGALMLDTLTMVELKDRLSGLHTAFFNTHLSYPHIEKREKQAYFIVEKLEEWAQRMPVVLMGDFNSFPNRRDLESLPYHDGDYLYRLFSKGSLKDARGVSLLGHVGPMGTFTNKGVNPTPFRGYGTPGVFLDHMYVSDRVKVLLHGVEPAKVNGYFPSDHMPVIVDVVII